MGVNIALLIPVEVKIRRNHIQCVQCLDDTISQVENFFHGKKHFTTGRYVEKENEDLLSQFNSEGLDWYSFEVPFLDHSSFDLCNGAWSISNGYRYSSYFFKYKDKLGRWRSWVREIVFDAVRMLGKNEIWLGGDELTSTFIENEDDSSFEAWKEYSDEYIPSTIYEFDFAKAKSYEEESFPEYEEKYHDSFKECYDLLKEYQECYPQYEILSIHPIGGYIIIAAGNDIYLMDPDTGCFLTNFPIDGIKEYDDKSVTIYRGDKYAKFDFNGKKLTEYC